MVYKTIALPLSYASERAPLYAQRDSVSVHETRVQAVTARSGRAADGSAEAGSADLGLGLALHALQGIVDRFGVAPQVLGDLLVRASIHV